VNAVMIHLQLFLFETFGAGFSMEATASCIRPRRIVAALFKCMCCAHPLLMCSLFDAIRSPIGQLKGRRMSIFHSNSTFKTKLQLRIRQSGVQLDYIYIYMYMHRLCRFAPV